MKKFFNLMILIGYALWCRLLLLLLSIIFFVPFIIFLCLPDSIQYSSKIVFYVIDFFYWSSLKIFLLPITYEGLENIPNQPVIFTANHQSSLDIPLLGHVAQAKPHVWLALSNLMDSTWLRFVLPRFSILVDVSSARKAVMSLHSMYELVKDKDCNIMIFPEGGRFVDGRVHEFFRGFALLAQKTGRPVVPVYIKGVADAYPPQTFFIRYKPITVTIGKPFVFLAQETDREFKSRVFAWFTDQQESKKI